MASELLGLLEAGFDGSGVEDTPEQHQPIRFGDLFESHGASGWINMLDPAGVYKQSFVTGAWPVQDEVLAACADLDWNVYVPLYLGWNVDPAVLGIIQRFNADGTSAGKWDRITHDGYFIDVTDMAYLPAPIRGAHFVAIGNDTTDGGGYLSTAHGVAIRTLDANGNVIDRWAVDDGGHDRREYVMAQLAADSKTLYYAVPGEAGGIAGDRIFAFDLQLGTQLATFATVPHGVIIEGITGVPGGGFLVGETRPDISPSASSIIRYRADGTILWETTDNSGGNGYPWYVSTMDYNRQTFWTGTIPTGGSSVIALRNLATGAFVSVVDTTDFPPVGDYTLNVRAANALPLRGAQPGDVLIQQTMQRQVPSDQYRRVVLRYQPDGHLVDVYDVDDQWVPVFPFDPDYCVNRNTVRAYDVDAKIYTLWNTGTFGATHRAEVMRHQPITHVRELVHSFLHAPNNDISHGLESTLSFDTLGNSYVTRRADDNRSFHVYKIDSAGAEVWMKVVTLPTGWDDDTAGGWLLRDNKTMLWTAFIDADGFEALVAADMSQPSPIALVDPTSIVWKVTSPDDGPIPPGTDYIPFYFDLEDFMVTDSDGTHQCEMFVTAANENRDDSRPVESTVAIRRKHGTETDDSHYESLRTYPALPPPAGTDGPPYYDEGWFIDRDPDGSIWAGSNGSRNGVYLYKFDRDTGARALIFGPVADQIGHELGAMNFCIYGGQAGHGGCLGPSVRRERVWVSWVG